MYILNVVNDGKIKTNSEKHVSCSTYFQTKIQSLRLSGPINIFSFYLLTQPTTKVKDFLNVENERKSKTCNAKLGPLDSLILIKI